MTTDNETWKPIPGFPGYDVSDHGRVRSYHTKGGIGEGWYISTQPRKVLKGGLNPQGYHIVDLLHESGRRIMKTVSSMVMLAFVGERPDGMEICHANGYQSDDSLSNLRYDTPQNNLVDMFYYADHKPLVSFTDEIIRDIRKVRSSGATYREIADKYNVTAERISKVCRRITYRDVTANSEPQTKG